MGKEEKTRDEKFKEFSESLPFKFNSKNLLKQVFVHRSYLNESNEEGLVSHERLEFLGDAVLQIVTSDHLYKDNIEDDEGALTKKRSGIVNRKVLADIAYELSLGDLLYLSKGEEKNGGRENENILGDTFEALIGAIYIDQGFDVVYKYLSGFITPLLKPEEEESNYFDYKPALQELCQSVFKADPVYNLVREIGPAHEKTYFVEVRVKGKVVGAGSGSKKKDAEQNAAQVAIVLLNKEYD